MGHSVLQTREPGGSELGREIRELLLRSSSSALHPRSELFLFLADRAQHVEQVIRPALESGKTVLCDRYIYSTLAYQGYGRGLPLAPLQQCNELAVSGLLPDLVLLLDADPEVGLRRAKQRESESGEKDNWNRFEEEKLQFHSKLRQGFLTMAESEPQLFVILDADTPKERIADSAFEAIALLE